MNTAALIDAGRTTLGIEFGSTRIKACLIGEDPTHVLAIGTSEWQNQFTDRLWTYSLEEVWAGVQAAYADLVAQVKEHHGVIPHSFEAIGISAMMHGYLAFDAEGELLVPFRTWRNTNTGSAAEQLTELFGMNIPLRWSIAHLYQAILNEEPHVPHVDFLTSLAGYVHWKLTGQRVVGIGDASGIFPIDSATHTYHDEFVVQFDQHAGDQLPQGSLRDLLPHVLVAGQPAGELSAEGALRLDPTGALKSGIPLCPPEGDASTGMVATNAVAPHTGNISAGTSIFAMVVLDKLPQRVHHELDFVTTPSGDPVALVHCNNGASELAAWAGLFAQFTKTAGHPLDEDTVFNVLFAEAMNGEADAGGFLAYNYLAGEPITGLSEGRPLVIRSPESDFTLANFMRSQLYGVFGTLSLGMRVLESEDVQIDRMFAHGGMFRTVGVAQRLLAAALNVPVAIGDTASEGGAWGIAVLARYLRHSKMSPLSAYLEDRVFAGSRDTVVQPDTADVAGYAAFLERYQAGLQVQAAAIKAL